MKTVPKTCFVCGGALISTLLVCPACETNIEGRFSLRAQTLTNLLSPAQLNALAPFAGLTPEQLFFLVTFVRCDGRLTRMEDELELSYPTLRGRLDEILQALGIEPARDEVTSLQISMEENQ